MTTRKPKLKPLAGLADVHLANHRRWGSTVDRGLNARCGHILAALERAMVAAHDRGCLGVISAGDLFDSTRPTPQVVAAMQRIIVDSKLPWLVLRGNHEMSSEWSRDTALEALAPVARVVDTAELVEFCGYQIACVPYVHGDASTWVPTSLAYAARERTPDLVVAHVGVKDEATPHHLANTADSIEVGALVRAALAADCKAVMVGNWHHRQSWDIEGVDVAQVGTLAPARFGEEGENYGWMTIFDPSRGVPFDGIRVAGPRFVTGRSVEELRGELGKAHRDDVVYARLVVDAGKRDEAAVLLRQLQAADGRVAGWAVEVELGERIERARAAARSARSPETLNEALARCVRELKDLPPTVDRDVVLAEARRFLA